MGQLEVHQELQFVVNPHEKTWRKHGYWELGTREVNPLLFLSLLYKRLALFTKTASMSFFSIEQRGETPPCCYTTQSIPKVRIYIFLDTLRLENNSPLFTVESSRSEWVLRSALQHIALKKPHTSRPSSSFRLPAAVAVVAALHWVSLAAKWSLSPATYASSCSRPPQPASRSVRSVRSTTLPRGKAEVDCKGIRQPFRSASTRSSASFPPLKAAPTQCTGKTPEG